MAFSKFRLTLAAILAFAFAPCALSAGLAFDDAKVDSNGNVVFTHVIENLPVGAQDLHAASVKYLQNEYKTTKYKDIECLADKGISYGKGNMNSFFTDNGLIKSEVFSADYFLRIDAKDNKARVQLIFTNYSVQKLSDTSDRQTVDVAIAKVAPFADAENNGRYKKAYKALKENADIVLNSVADKLHSVTPAPVVDEW